MWLWISILKFTMLHVLSLPLSLSLRSSASPLDPQRDATNKLQNKVGQKIWLASRANRDTVTDGAPNQCYLLSTFYPSLFFHFLWQGWSRSTGGKERSGGEEEEGGGVVFVCVTAKKKHWFWSWMSCRLICHSCCVGRLSTLSLLVDLNMSARYLLIMGLFFFLLWSLDQHVYTALYVIDRLLLMGSITVFTAEYGALTSTSPSN